MLPNTEKGAQAVSLVLGVFKGSLSGGQKALLCPAPNIQSTVLILEGWGARLRLASSEYGADKSLNTYAPRGFSARAALLNAHTY